MYEVTPQIIENRRRVVSALRAADDNLRLQRQSYDPETGRMCACAVAADAIGIPFREFAYQFEHVDEEGHYRNKVDSFPYDELKDALGMTISFLYGLNDEYSMIIDEGTPGERYVARYTFAEIGDKLHRHVGENYDDEIG